MKTRDLTHRIKWKDTWQKMRNERMKKLDITYEKDFAMKSAEAFSRQIKSNDYEYGRKITAFLKDILEHDFSVLEIGTGPGTLTIPLAKIVSNIKGIEFAANAIKHLKENLENEGLKNVEVINKNWLNIDDNEMNNRFDLVVCSHFLWQMEDLESHLIRMENASRKYCAVIQPCGRDVIVKNVFEKVCRQKYTGQFEPDADYFAYVMLREWNRSVDVRNFSYTIERNLEDELLYVSDFIGKFAEVNREIEGKIRNYLSKKTEKGTFREKNKAVVMWWQPEK